MNVLKKTHPLEKKSLGKKLGEFISDSRSNIDNKMKIITKLLTSIKEENENIITKSNKIFNKFIYIVINFCEKNNISIYNSRNTSSSNYSQSQIKQEKHMNLNNNNYSISINLKNQLNNNNNNNLNLNFGKLNNNFDIFDQTRNKFSIKFFEKLNLNNNNKGMKYYINDGVNTLNKNKLNYLNKDIIKIHYKEKNNLNNKNNEKILLNKIKSKKLIDLRNNNFETKNNFSSSYSNINNINNIIANIGNLDNKNKGVNIINNNGFRTLNLERKNSKNKIKNYDLKKEKHSRNLSNPGNINFNQKNKQIFNITTSPINNIKSMNSLKNQWEQNINYKSSVILNKINRENNDNNLVIDTKKLSIIDIPAPEIYNNNNSDKLLNNSNLTIKEKALYILVKSPIVSLTSQFILSRSSSNLKHIISKSDILLNYELYLNNKIKNFEEKQLLYDEKIKSVFNSTKIAEITLNFITSQNEEQFNENYNLLYINKENNNFIYYKNYVKIIYYIINESFMDENNNEINENKLLANLYDILNKKGFKKIKDYLYFLFISKQNKKENIFMNNIDKINKLILNESPRLLQYEESLKNCRFIVFSIYLIKEIIDYGNMITKTIELKEEENDFIKKMKKKLEKFHNKFFN